MAKTSTRRVTIYINDKEVEAFAKQIRVEMNRLHNERNLLLASERCIGNAQRRAEPPTNTSVSARTQTPPSHSGLQRKKILLLHRRTSVYEPRPNISPRPPRPRASSAGRRRLHTPAHLRRACVCVRRHRYRALQTYGLRGRVPVLHLHPPRNCSPLTANC